MNRLELTGRTDSHILYNESLPLAAEKETTLAFLEMKKEAEKEGLLLHAHSSFRGFNVQLGIWNAKFSGKKDLFSPDGRLLEFDSLSEEELIACILAWSALPGASRHHWGTDIDVIELTKPPKTYHPQLVPAEYDKGGVFHPLNNWLEKHMETFGFFRPYREFRGGVCAEPWHISFAPVSKKLIDELSMEWVREAITDSTMLGKEWVLKTLPEIFENYVLNTCE